MLMEVIRQEPRHADSYKQVRQFSVPDDRFLQVSEIYLETHQLEEALQYGMLAAYLGESR